MRWCLNGTSNAITFLMSLHFIDSVCITCDAFVCCRPVQEKKQKPKIRHDEFISPGPTVKNTKKYTKVIIQEKHDILYFQTGVMQMLRTTAAVQRTKARLTTFSSVYLQQFSRKKILPGAHISNTATAWQRLSFRWHSLKMHLCTTMWGTPRDWHHFYLLTGTCTISRKAEGKRPGSVHQSCTACSCRVHAGQLHIIISAMQKPKCYIS